MANIIKIKRGLEANLPSLAIGEIAYTTNTNKLFIGVNTGTIEAPVIQNVLVSNLNDLANYYTKTQIEALDGLGLVWNAGTSKFDADLATQGEAEAGTDNTKLMTPLRTKEAIDEQTGTILTSADYVAFADLATKQDAEDGTLNDVWMSPLRTAEAIAELAPTPVIATKEEAEAGSINNKFMTPLRTAEAIAELSSAVTISTTAPANPKEGDLWWDDSDGTLYIYYDPNGTPIWVEVTYGDQAVQFSDVLTRTNTDSYTPSADFHPATKKYVDDTTGALALGDSNIIEEVQAEGVALSITSKAVNVTRSSLGAGTGDADVAYYTTTIVGSDGSSNWVEETTGDWDGAFIATKTVSGIVDTDRPLIDLDLSAATFLTYEALQTDYALIFRVEASDTNEMKFYASEEPTEDLTITIKVVR